jgi:hypothetical protein
VLRNRQEIRPRQQLSCGNQNRGKLKHGINNMNYATRDNLADENILPLVSTRGKSFSEVH